MNNEYAVRVEHAVVRFNMASERIDNLKEYFVKLVRRELMFKEFFALKDVSFEVKKGEAWGIIGTNGSGKSTLLKLICGILKPYKGKVLINGSIAPLIELGAGFDGDLTARENIFLNGAVLGYDKQLWNSILMRSLISQSYGISLICRSRTIPPVWQLALASRSQRS